MNSINNTLTGLVSSLFHNVGLASAAEKFDPMRNRSENMITGVVASEPCAPCSWACNFTAETGE